MRKIRRLLYILWLRGWGYPWRLFRDVLVQSLAYRMIYENDLHRGLRWRVLRLTLAALVGALIGLVFGGKASGLAGLMAGPILGEAAISIRERWCRRRRLAQVRAVRSSYEPRALRWAGWAVDGSVRRAVDEASNVRRGPVCLGRFDNDGRFLGEFGDLPGLEPVSPKAFKRRYRFDLDLMLDGEVVVVRKNYRGDRAAFEREWSALARLSQCPCCPDVERVEEQSAILWKSFVPGPTVRDLLVRAGAKIMTVDTAQDPDLLRLTASQRLEAVWDRGRAVSDRALPPGFVERLEELLTEIHGHGITGVSLTFGNVIVEEATELPCLIDFDNATVHSSTRTMAFRRARDLDRQLFNRVWGGEILTESTAREKLSQFNFVYAPLDLGGGLVAGSHWTPDSGTGRWEVLNGRVVGPLVRGKTILDLGTNNGVMPMMMFREGARRVVALERDPEYLELAREIHALFEWRDMTRYDFDLRLEDMRAVCEKDFGTFDVVTAFCSLYYLDEEDMARVTRRVAEIAPIFIVQAKTDTRRAAAHSKAKKSSVEFLESLLKRNGFSLVERHSRPGFTRPILVATSSG